MVVSTADAHRSIANSCKPCLRDGQIIMLNPGYCGGALEVSKILREDGGRDLVIAEAGGLMYGGRSYETGTVLHTGLKVHVPVATLPAGDIGRLMDVPGPVFPCLKPVASVPETGFEGAGAMLHPIPSLMNVNKMDLGESYDYYMEGITPHIAETATGSAWRCAGPWAWRRCPWATCWSRPASWSPRRTSMATVKMLCRWIRTFDCRELLLPERPAISAWICMG